MVVEFVFISLYYSINEEGYMNDILVTIVIMFWVYLF
jgi:hypothetical protein